MDHPDCQERHPQKCGFNAVYDIRIIVPTYHASIVRNLSGSLGDQFVIRKGRGGETIVSNMPTSSDDRKFNQNELDHQEAFRHAILYAQSAKDNELYIGKADGTNMTAFNAAVADWFRKPAIGTALPET